MSTDKRFIDLDEALTKAYYDVHLPQSESDSIREFLLQQKIVDAVEVVRCKNCQHGVFDEEKGVWKCVESAEWDESMGDWFGFVVYHPSDFYCANGERRHNEN